MAVEAETYGYLQYQ